MGVGGRGGWNEDQVWGDRQVKGGGLREKRGQGGRGDADILGGTGLCNHKPSSLQNATESFTAIPCCCLSPCRTSHCVPCHPSLTQLSVSLLPIPQAAVSLTIPVLSPFPFFSLSTSLTFLPHPVSLFAIPHPGFLTIPVLSAFLFLTRLSSLLASVTLSPFPFTLAEPT